MSAWARQTGGVAWSLRYHNVYGPRMPRDTPYAGVASIFRSALARGEPPRLLEDGRQRRDFVHVTDVAAANVLALTADPPGDGLTPVNVCSGEPHTVGDLARALAATSGGPEPVVVGGARAGDVRHIVADPALARSRAGFPGGRRFRRGDPRLRRPTDADRGPAHCGRHRTVSAERPRAAGRGPRIGPCTSLPRSSFPASTRRPRCPPSWPRCPPAGRCSSSTTGPPTAPPRSPARTAPGWSPSRAAATAPPSTPASTAARADLVAVLDGDGSLDAAVLPEMAVAVASGASDLAVGRRVPQARGVWPWHARAANLLIAALLRRRGVPVHDIAPIRVARRAALLGLGVADRGFGYPLELLLRAGAAGWRIAETPVPYRARAGGRSKVSGSVRGTIRAGRDMAGLLR